MSNITLDFDLDVTVTDRAGNEVAISNLIFRGDTLEVVLECAMPSEDETEILFHLTEVGIQNLDALNCALLPTPISDLEAIVKAVKGLSTYDKQLVAKELFNSVSVVLMEK